MSFTRIPRANFSARASALLLAAAAFAAGAADTPAPAPSVEAQVQALAAKLGSDDPDERGNALEALIALGPGARAALEAQQAKAKDLDLKAQLRIALAGLDAGSAMARYERPKTIDLAAKGITVGEALNRLQEHFSWKVNASDEAAAKTLDLELKGATFFQTVEAIRAGAKLDFANTHGPWQQLQAEDAPAPGTELPVAGDLFPFKLVPAGPGNAGLAAFAAGPFLVYLQGYGIYAMRRLAPESGMATEQKTATLQVCVVAEPGVPVASVKSFNIALKDAKGTVLCGEQDPLNGFGGTAPFQAGGAQSRIDNLQFQVDAEVPGPLSWTGKLNATVPLKMETYRIEDLDAADQKPIQVGNAKMTFEQPQQDGESWTVTYTETQGAAGAPVGVAMGMAEAAGMVRTVSSSSFGAAAIEVGAGGEIGASGPPENEEGMFWIDEKGHCIQTTGEGGGGSNTEWRGHISMTRKPKSLLIRKVAKSADKEYLLSFTGIPAPDFSPPAAAAPEKKP